jgi:hypothetical protein
LHVAYGDALIAARGFGAPETTEAFRESPRVGVRRHVTDAIERGETCFGYRHQPEKKAWLQAVLESFSATETARSSR